MPLTSELISQFVKITRDNTNVKKETTLYGTVVYDGRPYVKLDGSDLLTPISTTTNIKDGERVTVMIKDHTATVTGNISSPSARTEEVKNVATQVSEFEVVRAHTVTADDIQAVNAIIENLTTKLASIDNLDVNVLNAINANIETLKAQVIEGEKLTVEDIEAVTATIESIEAEFGKFTGISTEDLEALNAEITNLKAYTADFTYISAVRADIKELNATKLSSKEAQFKYAYIDFTNIGEAAIDKFYALSGIIDKVQVSEGVFTKELIGVTVSADLIKTNTLVVSKLVVQGTDGKYYALSTDFSGLEGVDPVDEDLIHGSNIIAHSITAEKIHADDLSAFGGSIGGFSLTSHSIHSHAKESVENSNPGVYLDTDSQFAIGDMYSYIKFYKLLDDAGNEVLDENGRPRYKLAISADSILFGSDTKTALSDVKALTEHIRMGTYKAPIVDENGNAVLDEDGNPTYDEKPCIEMYESDTAFRQVITNVKTMFMDGDTPKTAIDTHGVQTENLRVGREIEHCGFVWAKRTNGNYGLSWKG